MPPKAPSFHRPKVLWTPKTPCNHSEQGRKDPLYCEKDSGKTRLCRMFFENWPPWVLTGLVSKFLQFFQYAIDWKMNYQTIQSNQVNNKAVYGLGFTVKSWVTVSVLWWLQSQIQHNAIFPLLVCLYTKWMGVKNEWPILIALNAFFLWQPSWLY